MSSPGSEAAEAESSPLHTFLSRLSPTIDVDGLIADLRREDCDDLGVLVSLAETDLASVLKGRSLGYRKRVWNLVEEAQMRTDLGRRKTIMMMEAAGIGKNTYTGYSIIPGTIGEKRNFSYIGHKSEKNETIHVFKFLAVYLSYDTGVISVPHCIPEI
jgi:hypothetical protein